MNFDPLRYVLFGGPLDGADLFLDLAVQYVQAEDGTLYRPVCSCHPFILVHEDVRTSTA